MIIPHPKHPKGGYYMEKALYENIQVLPHRINKDKDSLGLIVGSPGLGKSTITQQIAYPLDNKLNSSMICFDSDEYIKKSIDMFDRKISKGRAIIHDESKEALSAITVMSKKTRNFMNFLYENRQFNMYQFALTGDFFDVPKSIVMQRALFMIQVIEEGEFDNGHFHFFNGEDMKRLYIKGKKERNMRASGYTFRGTFPKFYTVDEDEYRKLKKDHIKVSRYVEDESKNLTFKEILIWVWKNRPLYRDVDIINFVGCDKSTYYKHKEKYYTEYVSE